jgi:hypothetical protein
MTTTGSTVLATDVNNPYNTGYTLMGQGSVGRGYGQTTFGGNVNVGDTITPGAYTNIRYDLLNASAHQQGTAAALALASEVTGNLIVPTNASAFASYANTVDSDRFTAHSTRLTTTAYGGNTRTSSWASAVACVYSLTFISSDVARYFWNAGGKVRFSSSRTGGAATSQNTSWSNLLSGAGTVEYGGASVYSLTTGLSTIYTTTAGSPYASNTYSIKARSDVSNVAGGARIFYFELEWVDPYTDPSPGNPPAPEDIVDGTLSYSVEIKYPTGGAALTPSGSWVGFNAGGAGGYYPLPTQSSGAISGS